MKYENAKDILPEDILKQVQQYAQGKLLYIPIENESKSWGEASGYRQKLMKRNQMICNKYANGITISELADEYFLSLDSIKKIIYCKKDAQLEFSNSLSSAVIYSNAGMAEEWIQTYLMFCTDCCDQIMLIKQDYIYLGVVKMPLRLIKIESETSYNKGLIKTQDTLMESEPLIVRYEKGYFYVDVQKDLLHSLKDQKINAYPVFILIADPEEYKSFMKNYGRCFIQVDKI